MEKKINKIVNGGQTYKAVVDAAEKRIVSINKKMIQENIDKLGIEQVEKITGKSRKMIYHYLKQSKKFSVKFHCNLYSSLASEELE